MRRRLFWTIAGVAAVTGLLVLVGSVVASQRAAVEATFREMGKSADEAVALIQDATTRAGQRPGAVLDLLRTLEGDQLGPFLLRLSRTAGGSEFGFAVLTPLGDIRTTNPLFDRVELDTIVLDEGRAQFTRSATGELVVITPTEIRVGEQTVTLLLGLAREAPVVRIADQMGGLAVIVAGIGIISAVLARLLSAQLSKRLEPLARASRSLAGGDMTARVPDLGDPELDDVAAAFNEMASELEESRRREREFILGVGHDLRTPLTTIGGYAEALEDGEVGEDEIPRVGAVLARQSRQLGRLIEDLSTLARLEQPEFDLRLEPVDVGAHVGEIVEGFRRRAEELEVRLGFDGEEGLTVDTDPDRLAQIAQNLVENALRYTPETGKVSVRVAPDGTGVVIEVTDTGVGIDPEDLPHVFDRHFVGRRRQVRNEGTGLGLSIVKGLVARMGGSVEARSRSGHGTTIEVRLPGPG